MIAEHSQRVGAFILTKRITCKFDLKKTVCFYKHQNMLSLQTSSQNKNFKTPSTVKQSKLTQTLARSGVVCMV